MMADATPCYIAREPECGCATVAIVDDPAHKKSTAKDIARCIRDGMTVERITVEEARKLIGPCKHRNTKESK